MDWFKKGVPRNFLDDSTDIYLKLVGASELEDSITTTTTTTTTSTTTPPVTTTSTTTTTTTTTTTPPLCSPNPLSTYSYVVSGNNFDWVEGPVIPSDAWVEISVSGCINFGESGYSNPYASPEGWYQFIGLGDYENIVATGTVSSTGFTSSGTFGAVVGEFDSPTAASTGSIYANPVGATWTGSASISSGLDVNQPWYLKTVLQGQNITGSLSLDFGISLTNDKTQKISNFAGSVSENNQDILITKEIGLGVRNLIAAASGDPLFFHIDGVYPSGTVVQGDLYIKEFYLAAPAVSTATGCAASQNEELCGDVVDKSLKTLMSQNCKAWSHVAVIRPESDGKPGLNIQDGLQTNRYKFYSPSELGGQGGKLWFTFNDLIDKFSNNTGTFTVNVAVYRPCAGTPTTTP